MCGIAGFYTNSDLGENVLHSMVNSLLHRGPDAEGLFVDKPFFGGMRRLSINDLHGGDQPLYSQDRSIVMLYNGEIYNSPQLRKALEVKGYIFRTRSDGEVICHLFQEMGVKAFDQLDGMFAVSLWDKKTRTLYLVRDIPGEKPLYYTRMKDGGLAYASELRAFKEMPDLDLNLNFQALWDFPTFLWVPEPQTVYENVYALQKGHMLSFDGTECVISPLANPYKGKFDGIKITAAHVRDVVERSIKSRLLADVPVGCFLSSGLDSSIVTTIAQRELKNITTFSVGFENVDDPYHGKADESSCAKEYADLIHTKHHEIRVSALDFKKALNDFCFYGDQPFAVSSGFGILFVSKVARESGIKTLLSGDGADELFGGYSWYKDLAHPFLKNKNRRRGEIVSYQNFGMGLEERLPCLGEYDAPKRAWAWHYYAAEEEKRCIFNPEMFRDTLSSYRYFKDYKSNEIWEPEDYIRHDREFYLPFEMMRKMDRMTMAHSVEGRAPFVAPEILELSSRLSYEDMVQGDVLKPLLRDAFADLLPEVVTNRPKHGFNVPIDHWLKGAWGEVLDEALSENSALSRLKILNPKGGADYLRAMVLNKQRLNGHSVFCLIMLNMWLEQQGF